MIGIMTKEYLHRKLSDQLKKWLDRREILAIKGPRQSGKTTLLQMLKDHLVFEKKVEKEQVLYLTLEDIDILEAFSRDPRAFIKSYIGGKKDRRYYFLIDEFHYLHEGGQKLKLLYDLFENIKFIITGSSSLELTGGTSRYLVGRVFSFYLFPFCLEEFLETKESNLYNIYRENTEILRKFIIEGKDFEVKEEIFEKDFLRYFEEYVGFGGYPEVIKTDDLETKQVVLKNIYDTYITRDIVELLRLGDVSTFRTIVTLLANSMGGLTHYGSLASDGNSYFRQIKHYLSILEETYVIRILKPYSGNLSTELKKNPKVYFIDSGLRNYIVRNFNETGLRPDGGKLVENVALSELYQKGDDEIRYWRTTGRAEVDFILKKGEEVLPVEVKYSKPRTPEISRGFRSFISQYEPQRALILTKGFWGKIEIQGTKIGFIPVWYI